MAGRLDSNHVQISIVAWFAQSPAVLHTFTVNGMTGLGDKADLKWRLMTL
jgi:hypothetical protein